MLLKTKTHNITIKDDYFAKGGEGCVHDVTSDRQSVAKIYHAKQRTNEREQKILAMLSSPPMGNLSRQVAWPTDILYSQSGDFMGFIMPRISGTIEISEIYSFDNRKKYPYTFYIQVAQNLCAAINAVHSGGHVCGDLNHANIHVDPKTSLVTLVDTDSYEIKGKRGRRFRCPVGLPEYVPAEVGKVMNMGENLRTTSLPTFNKYTDYFALGIHVFKLLMNGAHPFACSVTNSQYSGSDFTLDKNIVNGILPYKLGENKIAPPKYAPYLKSLPQGIVKLAMKTFDSKTYLPSMRATPQQWYDELDKLEKNLTQCANVSNHQYFSLNKTCPLCDTENKLAGVLNKTTGYTLGARKIPTATALPITTTIQNPSQRSQLKQRSLPGMLLSAFNKKFIGVIIATLVWLLVETGVFLLMSLIPLSGWLWNIIIGAVMFASIYLPYLICEIFLELFYHAMPNRNSAFGGFYYTLRKCHILAFIFYPIGLIALVITNVFPNFSFNISAPSFNNISFAGPIGFIESLPLVVIFGGAAIIAIIIVFLLREVTIVGFAAGFICWACFQVFGLWLMNVINISAWWFWFVSLAWFTLVPFIPLWIFCIIDVIFLPVNTLWENMCSVLNVSYFLTIICYGGFAIYATWGTGLLNLILTPILICAPATFMVTKFPDITIDII